MVKIAVRTIIGWCGAAFLIYSLVFEPSCRARRSNVSSWREYNISGVAALIRQYRESHDGALPSSQQDLFTEEGREMLAKVFWPEEFRKELGTRPAGWPASAVDLNRSRLYRFLKKDEAAARGLIVVEGARLRSFGGSGPESHVNAISTAVKTLWLHPAEVPPDSAFVEPAR